MEGKLYSGFYKPEENKTCDECGVDIIDYTIYEGVIRCVGCSIEFDIRQFHDVCSNGVYAIPRSPEEPKVKVRSLYNYCQQKGGISPGDLTPEEIKRFLVSEKERRNEHRDEKI